MWKRDDDEKKEKEKKVNAERSDATAQSTPGSGRKGRRRGGEEAVIGSSIRIRGEVAGDEDLMIQGKVDGTVDLDQNSVTVGPEGEVIADITGRVITVEGHVEGDLTADEQIVLRSSARVEGDISAPRVVLEDGARFRGGVEMEEGSKTGRQARKGGSGGAGKAKESAKAGEQAVSAASSSGGGKGTSSGGSGSSAGDED